MLPVVGLHGLLLGSSATWFFPAMTHLGDRATVHCVDWRGHGLSDTPAAGYDLDSMVQDLKEVLEAWEIERPVMMGHSYGALVALKFACEYPDKVKQLVLVEPPFPLSEQKEMQSFLSLTPDEMIQALPKELQDSVRTAGRQGKKLLRRLHRLVHETSLLQDLERGGAESFTGISDLRLPTLLVFGKASSCRVGGMRLANLIHDSRTVTIDGGHYLPSENPGALMSAIGEFLDG